jgi:hypothetical protein
MVEPLSWRWRRALAPCALLALLPLAAAAGGGDGGSPAEQVRLILEDAAGRQGAARRLAGLGAPAAPALVQALAEGGSLSEDQREALLGGLALLDRAAVLAALEALATAPPAERRAVLAALERLGRPEDLALALRTAFPQPRSSDGSAGSAGLTLDAELAAAAGGILARNPEGLGRIPHLVAVAETPAGAALARGVGISGRKEGIEVLSALLDLAPELEQCLVSEVGRLAVVLPPPFAQRALEEVRKRLDSADLQVVREAALASGRLLDDAALPRLVELLDDPRPPVAEAALFALRSITGLTLPAESARWEEWLAAEQEWFDTQLSATRARLASRDARAVQAGLREIALRRTHRLELAADVEPLLSGTSTDVCIAACRTLATLGACSRMASLIDCLDDSHAPLAAEAWRALQAITGKSLPGESEAWRAEVGAGAVVRR